MTLPLFHDEPSTLPRKETLAEGAVLLRGFALAKEDNIRHAVESVTTAAPFRHLITPGGYRMSVAMTNCGSLGWVSDRTGYRYSEIDPDSGRKWPTMPDSFLSLAATAAAEAEFPDFRPDACLINRYEPGAKLSLHQDKDEIDFAAPIVSVSLGVPATFLFGGLQRSDKTQRISVIHGDVVVWGGPSRLRYHGVAPLRESHRPLLGSYRVNLTFRKVK
jgi:DNA oxidative demethylase